MKTTTAVFTKSEKHESSIHHLKRYTYNIEGDVKEGDVCKVSGTKGIFVIQIVQVTEPAFNYVDTRTGKLYDLQTGNLVQIAVVKLEEVLATA